MKKEMERFLPQSRTFFDTKKGDYVYSLTKTPDQFRLSDLYKLGIGEKHIAWIMSGLYNIACYLQYANIYHSDISMDTVFISPEHHAVSLLGGWEFSGPLDSKLTLLPARTHKNIIFEKLASSALVNALIKRTGRELYGDKLDKKSPVGMFLTTGSTSSPVDEYRKWMEVLEAQFGPRKFIKWSVNPNDVYK